MNTIPYIQDAVRRLKPGESLRVEDDLLPRGRVMEFTSADWVLEGILGAAYEYSYKMDPMTRDLIFSRAKAPLPDGSCTYVSPDRRHYFRQGSDGIWHRLSSLIDQKAELGNG